MFLKLALSILFIIFVVNASVRIKQNRNISFGQVFQGSISTKAIPSTCSTAEADTNLGKTQFDHSFSDSGTTVTIDWTTPSTLDDGGGNTIIFTNNESWCTNRTSGNTQDITDWGSGTYTGQGTSNDLHNIYWGGSVNVLSGTPPGIYSGTINIILSY